MMPGPHTPSRPGAREMTSSHAARALGVAALGAIVLFLILFSPAARSLLPSPSVLHSAARTLKGASAPADLAADIIGLRAMARQEDAYPILGQAAKALGLQWPVNHVSTHPPMACLLVAPVAFLPWPLAAMLWAWMMLALLAFSFRLYGLPWLLALGLTPIALLWPPVATSLGQLTIIWLWGFALGFRNRQHNHFLAGIGLGLAALTKLVPGLMIILFLSKKRWHAFLGMALVGTVSLASVLVLSPASFTQYFQANRSNARAMFLREDNASLLGAGYRWGAAWGVIVAIMFLALVCWANRKAAFDEKAPFPTARLWMLLTYVLVALLPLFWIYSLTPLLPVIGWLLGRGKLSTLAVGLCCIGIPLFVPIWGVAAVLPLVLVNVLVGVGLLVDASRCRVLTADSFRALLSGPREAPAQPE